MAQRGRRRIDRVAASDFLDGVEERPTDEVRAMRDDCREEEERLSYARRLLQGRIDITRAELERRRSGDSAGGGLIDTLPSILADRTSSRRGQSQARPSPLYVPADEHSRRADDDQADLAQLPDLDDDALAELLARLTSDERALSDLRRRVLDHLDRLQDEIVTRLRDGRIDAADLAPGGDGAPHS